MSGKIFGFDKNFNKKDSAEIIVSATEPTGENRKKVWIQKGNNLFDGKNVVLNNFIDGGGNLSSSTVSNTTDYIKINPNENYVVLWNNIDGNTRQVVFYDENKNWISYIQTANYPFTFKTPTNAKYLRFSYCNTSTEIMLKQGSTATEYETYIEPKIYVKNDNDIYEEFISKEDDFTDYKSSLVKEDTYVSGIAINWCEVKNGIAYISMNLTLVAGEMSNTSSTLVSGLPIPKLNAEIQTHLYNSTENHSIRARITTAGLLRWWYNPAITVKSNNALSVNISYPVA